MGIKQILLNHYFLPNASWMLRRTWRMYPVVSSLQWEDGCLAPNGTAAFDNLTCLLVDSMPLRVSSPLTYSAG
ncbi:hypothetical protein J6590_006692 [Homalodisca vitripennis]|nr:hypothetical protein J6590_006692 [Homalodisca vitripennis]